MDGSKNIGLIGMDRPVDNGKSGMDKYENLGKVGEGSYGLVVKCRNTQTGQMVAIKKFLESEEDKQVKKIAMREVKMLKMLRHDNLVNLLEVFKRKKKLYLVFEYVDRTLLDDLEKNEYGLEMTMAKEYLWQILSAVEFCHSRQVIHRDVKPENILVSKEGVVKLCDFGFARIVANCPEHTDYVATRWYRAPELLVGDTSYGKPVDVWAIGCLYSEMLNAEPLFPGDSDIDQMNLIVKCLGNLTHAHTQVFLRNSLFIGIRLPQPNGSPPQPITLDAKLPNIPKCSMSFLKACLDLDPANRLTCEELLNHEVFTENSFNQTFPEELKAKIRRNDRANGRDKEKKRRAQRDPQVSNTKASSHTSSSQGGLPDATGKKSQGTTSQKSSFQLPQLGAGAESTSKSPSKSTGESKSKGGHAQTGGGGSSGGDWGGNSKSVLGSNLKGMPSFPHMEKVAKPPFQQQQQQQGYTTSKPPKHSNKTHHLPKGQFTKREALPGPGKEPGLKKVDRTPDGPYMDESSTPKPTWVKKLALPKEEGGVFAEDKYSNECSSISEARKICEANPEVTGFAHKPDDNWFFFKTGFSESGAEWATTDEDAGEGNWEFHFIRERA